jgi:hypothetical protein
MNLDRRLAGKIRRISESIAPCDKTTVLEREVAQQRSAVAGILKRLDAVSAAPGARSVRGSESEELSLKSVPPRSSCLCVAFESDQSGDLISDERVETLGSTLSTLTTPKARIGLCIVPFSVVVFFSFLIRSQNSASEVSQAPLYHADISVCYAFVINRMFMTRAALLLERLEMTAERVELTRLLRSSVVDPDRGADVIPVVLAAEPMSAVKLVLDTLLFRNP